MKLQQFSFPLILIASVVLNSCGGDSPTDRKFQNDSLGGITGRDSLEMGITDSSRIDSSFTGFFQSELPCRNCEGVQQTLHLMNNGRYHLEDRHHDNSFSTEQYSGTWANEADRLILFEGQAIIAKYQLAQGKLKTLERQGILFNDSLANKNILARRPSILENLAWKNKKDAGMEVYGVGTEPFWNISIGKQLIIFNHIDSGPVQFAYTEPEYRGDSIIYSLPADSLRIILSAGICNDGMSDFFYDYSIDVSLKKQVFRGCGSYFGTEARKPGKLVSRIEQNKNPAF